MTWQVVGCSTCHGYWLAQDLHTQKTAECPHCFTTHETQLLDRKFEHESREVAAEIRARILAERAGELDAYDAEGDYLDQADRVNAQRRFREEFLADAADHVFEDADQLFDDAVEASFDRWADHHDRFEDEAWAAFSEHYDRFEDGALNACGQFYDRYDGSHTTSDEASQRWTDGDLPSLDEDGAVTMTRQGSVSPDATLALDKPLSALSKQVVRGLRGTIINGLRARTDTVSIPELHDLLVERDLDLPDADLPKLAVETARGSTHAAGTLRRVLWQASTGRRTTEDMHVVPELLALIDQTPTITVHLDDEFHARRRSQREAICRYLGALARGCDVRLVGTGRQQLTLYREHREHLPVSRADITPLAESQTQRAEHAKEALAPESREVALLRTLADEDSETLSYRVLDSRLTVSRSRRSQLVSTLRDLGLVDTFGPQTCKHVELLPVGRQFVDWLDEETARQQTLDDCVSDVCNSSDDSRVQKRAHVRGGDRRRLPPLHTTQLLPRWDATATAASTPENGLAVVDHPLQEQSDRGSPRWHYDDSTDTLVVGAEYDGAMQYWVCVARALASRRTFDRVLDEGERIDETEDLAEFLTDHKAILRDSLCLGYLPDAVEDGRDYLDELQQADDHLCELTKTLVAGDYEGSEAEFRGTITREAMGLAKTMLDLLDSCGVEVVQQVRLPRQNGGRHDVLKKERRVTLRKSVVSAVKLHARIGRSSVYRQLFETDDDRRAAAITPSLDAFDVAEPAGRICIVGDLGSTEAEFVEELRRDLRGLDEDVHEDAPNLSVRVPVESTTDLPRQRYGRAVERLCSSKNLRPTREAVSLLRLFTGTPFDAARAVSGLRSETDGPRDLRVSEVRYALAQLDDSQILPWETSGVRSLVAALLRADRALSGTALADRAGVSRGTWQNHKDWLSAIGLVSESERGYRLVLAFNTDDERYHDERRPWFVKSAEDSELPFVVAVRSLGSHLAMGLLPEDEQGAAVREFVNGTRDPAVVVERWPRLAPWLRALRAVTGDDPPTPDAVVFGQPDGQARLQAGTAGGGSA